MGCFPSCVCAGVLSSASPCAITPVQVLHCCERLGGERVLPPPADGATDGVFLGAQLREASALLRQNLVSPADLK